MKGIFNPNEFIGDPVVDCSRPTTDDAYDTTSNNGKKYKLTDETSPLGNMRRIKALRDFADVKKGDLGGFVESEDNLSQYGDCWIYDDAKAIGHSKVIDNAQIRENAVIRDFASVGDRSIVRGKAMVTDIVMIRDNAIVEGCAVVSGIARLSDNAHVSGKAIVQGNTVMSDDSSAYGNAVLSGNANILENAVVCGKATMHNGFACGNAMVCGNVNVFDNPTFSGDAVISGKRDYITFHNWWSSGRTVTWTRSNDMWKAGCFEGTGEQLVEKAYADSPMSGREYKRIVVYVEEIKKYL